MPFKKGNTYGSEALRRYWAELDHSKSRSLQYGKNLVVRLSQVEFAELDLKAKNMGLSRAELVVRSTRAYSESE